MDVEIYEIMDEIMEINHQIATYMIDFAKAEISGTRIKDRKMKGITLKDIENNKIFRTLFENLQTKYRELQEAVFEDTEIRDYEDGEVVLNDFMKKNLKVLPIEDLELYLENAYADLNYIEMKDAIGKKIQNSIYSNQEFENLRTAEYNLQVASLENIDMRLMFNQENSKLSFQEKAYILTDISIKRFDEQYAIKQIEEYIRDLERKKHEMKPEEYKKIKTKLYEQKYIIFYSYLNSKYNGIIQKNDIGKFALIERCINDDALGLILNMSDFEIEGNIKINMKREKDEFKNNVRRVLGSCKSNLKTKQKNKEERVENEKII